MPAKNTADTTHPALQDDTHQEAHDDLITALVANITECATTIELALTDGKVAGPGDAMKEYQVEYLTSRFLGILCWFAKSEGDRTRSSITQMANQLRGQQRRFRGSEIEDTKMQQSLDRIEDRGHQRDIIDAIRDAAEAAYFELTGLEYTVTKTMTDQAQTATSLQAAALVAAYADPEKSRETPRKADDRRPAVWTDQGTGESYSLGEDGQYHPMGK